MKPEKKHYAKVLNYYESNKNEGLKQSQLKSKLDKYGYNKLKSPKKTHIIVKFLKQFNDFMIIILLISALVSYFVSFLEGHPDYVEPLIILFIVSLNAILGLVQENKAEKSIEALKKMSSPCAKVLRDGVKITIDAQDVVPGDIIFLEIGDLVPADARLITSINLKCDESSLTGESNPVEKDCNIIFEEDVSIADKKNLVFSSSSIISGKGTAIVTATGMFTEVGKIASMMLEQTTPPTPLQKKLEHIGKILGISSILICCIIFVLGIFKKIPYLEIFMTSVSLAVAAIPEGLPTIVTIVLAIGVKRMSSKNAIIRRLPAVETLGNANIICSDKTGTLTQNKMKVVEVCDVFGKVNSTSTINKKILSFSTLCNNCTISDDEKIEGDATEKAIIMASINLNIKKDTIEKQFCRIFEIPFDSKRKLMTTVHTSENNGYLVITKGAPDILLKKCTHYYFQDKIFDIDKSKKDQILAINENMAKKALRVLAVSYKYVSSKPSPKEEFLEKDLIFLGFIGIIDPPRDEVKDAIKICKNAGIKPVMLTGDHAITAHAIATKIGLCTKDDKVLTGDALDKMSQVELNTKIFEYCVFARLAPIQKVKIVKAFQSNNCVVAMTGDGVNDAPSLKISDIGCSMGISGTDVAKSASDMILSDDNFTTIVDAIKEGRSIYSNIKKAVHFLLSSNIGEIITILSAILFGFQIPLLAVHLLWVNLVTDSLPAIALGLDPAEKNIMDKKPHPKNKSLFSDGLSLKIFLEGCMIGMLALISFGIGCVFFDTNSSVIVGRSMAFSTLSISQLFHAFNMRSEESIFKINLFQNIYLIYSLVIGLCLQIVVVSYIPLSKIFKVVPLNFIQWILVLILSLMPIVIVELEKFILNINYKKNNTKFFLKNNVTN